MLEKVIELTNGYIDTMPKKERKKYGQFFTSMETARFMANLYDITSDMTKISVLGCRSWFRHFGMRFFRTDGKTAFCRRNRGNLL